MEGILEEEVKRHKFSEEEQLRLYQQMFPRPVPLEELPDLLTHFSSKGYSGEISHNTTLVFGRYLSAEITEKDIGILRGTLSAEAYVWGIVLGESAEDKNKPCYDKIRFSTDKGLPRTNAEYESLRKINETLMGYFAKDTE